MLGAIEAVHSLLEIRRERCNPLNHVFFHQHVQGCNARRAGHRVCRVGVAVGEFEHVVRAALRHEGVVDFLFGNDCTQRLRAVGYLLGHIHDVGRHAKRGRTGVGTHTAKAGDDLVKNQQDVVGSANLAQALQVAHRRHHNPCRTRHGLHDHRRNVGCVVQCNQLEQLIGQRGTGRRHAFVKRAGRGLRVGQVVGLDTLAKRLAVGHNAAHGYATKVNTVVALLAANQAGLGAHALGTPVGPCHLQRGIGRLGA